MWWLHQSADWCYSTNVSEITSLARGYVSEIYSDWMKKWKFWARSVDQLVLPPDLKRIVGIMTAGVAFTHANEARLMSAIRSKATKIYSSARIIVPELNATAEGEVEVDSLMGSIRDPKILKNVWRSWREQVAEEAKPLFLELVQLANRASWDNGYSNIGSSWKEELGIDDVEFTALSLWNGVKSFYNEIHAYTRHKLQLLYGESYFQNSPFIPAHLLGSLWGENWASLSEILLPYPSNSFFNITSSFISKGYTVNDLVRKAEEFYIAADLYSMEDSFWEKSMFVKPTDGRVVDCHSVAYDFALHKDFRIRMCGGVKEQSFMQAVHEMGHVQYYMAYHHQPMIYRNGANSAFHEAVGETMVYAAQSPKCLQFLKITEFVNTSRETFLNGLMKQALSKFVLLPWALTVEMWRYKFFAGKITKENMIEKWWELRRLYQGIEPPDVENAKLFDPGSKYHVINNIPYMRYFFSRFMEHQFLEALCTAAGQSLHSCCFIESKNAGRKLKDMLSLGATVSWQDALERLSGQRHLSSESLMKYYRPLYLWLIEYNRRHNISVNLSIPILSID